MKKALATFVAVGLLAAAGYAHFQVLVPSDDIVEQGEKRSVNLEILFTHPMAGGPVMEMGAPAQFGVLLGDRKKDLLKTLKAEKRDGKTAFQASYEIKQPGDHIFYLEPAPYWEPAEQKMIVHYTKVVVSAFGEEEGWDRAVGFPVEIEPLTRPYGLWTGNIFCGIVKKGGEPVPFAEVEVEYYDQDGKVKPPADAFVTQVVKADRNGVFAYAMPKAGWWSFAALVDGDEKMKNPEGAMVDVELGALLWVKTADME